jgi:putative nucleotidyltransferase with HDIG domain
MTIERIKDVFLKRLAPQQRLRWLLLLMVVLVFTAILYPGLMDTDFAYRIGDVAERDIKASQDFLIEDQQATETNRQKAAEETLTVYDHDVLLARNLTRHIDKLFDDMRRAIDDLKAKQALQAAAQPDTAAPLEPPAGTSAPPVSVPPPDVEETASLRQVLLEKQAQFGESLGLRIDDDVYELLVDYEFSQAIADPIIQILYEIMQAGVVSNKEILLRESEKGIILRTVGTNKERVVYNLRQFYDLEEAKMMVRITGQPVLKDLGYANADLIVDLVQDLIQPNITLNRNETQERREAAVAEVKPVFHKIKAGEMLLREGERVTAVQALKLHALQEEQRNQRIARSSLGAAMIMFCVLLSAYLLRYHQAQDRLETINKDILFLSVVLCSFFVIAEVAGSLSRTLAQDSAFSFEALSLFYATPISAATMLVCLFLGLQTAVLTAVVLAIGAAIVFHGSLEAMLFFLVSGAMAAYWIQNCRERRVFIKAGLMTGLLNMALAAAIGVYTGFESWAAILWGCAFGFLGGMTAAIIATGLVPLIEMLFEYSSDIKLLELANLDQPLMRQLMIEAPGTYHHSVIVGNLVEAAAAEIGANPLLAKVCGYYHDIGKIRKPAYFIENQKEGRNRHDKLAPSMSALILIAHVKDGIDLARRHKLGEAITDTIRQHHGTSLIHYFYDKAKQIKGEDAVKIDDFRYPGPKPQTREAGLVMLADVVEAASRVLDNPTPSRIQGLVQRLINRIFSDGQLDNCELTLRDLHNIAKSFNTILNGIHHHRIEYPEKRGGAVLRKKARNGSTDRKSTKAANDRQRAAEEDSRGHLKRLGLS